MCYCMVFKHNRTILSKNVDVFKWFHIVGNVSSHSTVYFATAGLSKCFVSSKNKQTNQNQIKSSSVLIKANLAEFASSGIRNQLIGNRVFISYFCDTLRLPAWGCRLLLRALGVSYEIRGIENIRKNHGAVVVINHQSGIDLAGKQVLFLFFFFEL